jgi:pimeloyl-ACP methyl ester carboxylesterase
VRAVQGQLTRSITAVVAIALAAPGCADSSSDHIDTGTDAGVDDVATAETRDADHGRSFPVELRRGVTADLHVRVFVDETRRCGGALLAVHGMSHTAATWAPFAEAVFAAGGPCRVYALDLPGHGASGLPRGLPFGGLVVDDYATALQQALQHLQRDGADLRVVIGHSMGGLLIQQVQARLRGLGADLAALGVRGAVLIAATPPAEVLAMQCGQRRSGGPALGPGSYLRADLTRGVHITIPDDTWRALFFSDRSGALAPSAPALDDVAGYSAPEPVPVVASVLGVPFARPSIAAGAFAGSGTAVTVAAFEQDPFGTEAEQRCLLDHLAGAGHDLVVVRGPESVHDAYIAIPDDVVAALAGAL